MRAKAKNGMPIVEPEAKDEAVEGRRPNPENVH